MGENKIMGAVFDMDGVLIDTEKLYVRFWKQSAADFGYNMTDEHVFGIRSLARKFANVKLKNMFGEEFPYAEVREHRTELMDEYIAEYGIETKKGLFEMLGYLRENGIKIAVATATPKERAVKRLEEIGALRYIDAVVGGDMVQNGKPEPDIYLMAASELGLPPENCAAFEDSPNGIKAAYSAGCHTVMIPDLTPPDEEIMPMLSAVYESLDKATAFFEDRRC
ncbi:MAG: HAD family phosphatase [Ruminococcus sp.]|nr:HAD family phosphatase [Ruminococcus sp.]